jgi:hypothetical protein
MVYLTTMPTTQTIWRLILFVSNDYRLGKDVERSALSLILSSMPEFVRRAMKILQQDSPSLGRDFKLAPPE